jgi:hypothetical protein
MIAPERQVVLFDNSALNHLFGQSPHIDEGMRVAVIERMKATAPTVVALNAGLLGEVAGLFFSNRARFDQVSRLLFQTCDWHVVRPAFDDKVRPVRVAMEVQLRGRVPWERVIHPRRETKWMAAAFLDGKRSKLDVLARDASDRKKKFAVGERERRAEAEKELAEGGQRWDAEFKGWEADPSTVVDEWTLFDMRKNPRFYGLPADEERWPKPRDFVTLWFSRAYQVARLHEIFGENRKADDGSDLYDGMYFQEAAYADVLVTGDRRLAGRVKALRLATPRILSTEEWVAELIGEAGASGSV